MSAGSGANGNREVVDLTEESPTSRPLAVSGRMTGGSNGSSNSVTRNNAVDNAASPGNRDKRRRPTEIFSNSDDEGVTVIHSRSVSPNNTSLDAINRTNRVNKRSRLSSSRAGPSNSSGDDNEMEIVGSRPLTAQERLKRIQDMHRRGEVVDNGPGIDNNHLPGNLGLPGGHMLVDFLLLQAQAQSAGAGSTGSSRITRGVRSTGIADTGVTRSTTSSGLGGIQRVRLPPAPRRRTTRAARTTRDGRTAPRRRRPRYVYVPAGFQGVPQYRDDSSDEYDDFINSINPDAHTTTPVDSSRAHSPFLFDRSDRRTPSSTSTNSATTPQSNTEPPRAQDHQEPQDHVNEGPDWIQFLRERLFGLGRGLSSRWGSPFSDGGNQNQNGFAAQESPLERQIVEQTLLRSIDDSSRSQQLSVSALTLPKDPPEKPTPGFTRSLIAEDNSHRQLICTRCDTELGVGLQPRADGSKASDPASDVVRQSRRIFVRGCGHAYCGKCVQELKLLPKTKTSCPVPECASIKSRTKNQFREVYV